MVFQISANSDTTCAVPVLADRGKIVSTGKSPTKTPDFIEGIFENDGSKPGLLAAEWLKEAFARIESEMCEQLASEGFNRDHITVAMRGA